MEVILAVEAAEGTQTTVSVTAETYEKAWAAAKARIPDGFKTIVIRTDRY